MDPLNVRESCRHQVRQLQDVHESHSDVVVVVLTCSAITKRTFPVGLNQTITIEWSLG
jgi:hypothetical protein